MAAEGTPRQAAAPCPEATPADAGKAPLDLGAPPAASLMPGAGCENDPARAFPIDHGTVGEMFVTHVRPPGGTIQFGESNVRVCANRDLLRMWVKLWIMANGALSCRLPAGIGIDPFRFPLCLNTGH